MQSQKSSSASQGEKSESVKRLLREAKKLHKAARSELLSKSLPVLRRLISSQTLVNLSLPELHANRAIVQRKHILSMLAFEAGYKNWAEFRQAIEKMPEAMNAHYAYLLNNAGYPNLWFSSLEEAKNHTAIHGGTPLQVGDQAVVILNHVAAG